MPESMQDTDRTYTFAELGVPGPLVRALAADGKRTAFPIQADTLPDSLAGRDVLGRGRTGSGKTLAFSIPLVARLGEIGMGANPRGNRGGGRRTKSQSDDLNDRDDSRLPRPRGLVLAPTRELANQINDVLAPLARMYGMATTTIYGGVRYNRQFRELREGADIVVACPGRLEDLIEQKALALDNVQVAVIDEADEMADMGFLPPVKRLLGQISFDAQVMLFSATLDHGVDEVVETFLSDPKVHSVDSATSTVDEMTHHVFETTRDDKAALVKTLASGKSRRIMFTRTKFQAVKLAKELTQAGVPAAELHGNLSQNQRDRNLAAFDSGDVHVMVATDVAARGIDISGVELVVQVEPPDDPKSFLHRSGRTARAGQSGDVVTLMLPEQRRKTRRMMREAGLQVRSIKVRSDSPEVLELVGEQAEPVFGWTLEQSQPAGNPRRRNEKNDRKDGRGSRRRKNDDRFGKSGKRRDRRDRENRRKDDTPRAFEVVEETRDIQEASEATTAAAKNGKARNDKRREKYERRHAASKAEREQRRQEEAAQEHNGGKAKSKRKADRKSDRKSGYTVERKADRNDNRSTKQQRKSYDDRRDNQDRRNDRNCKKRRTDNAASSGKRIHRNENRVRNDERSEDVKRHERRMKARYGDKHAGGPHRRHAKIKRAPFRTR